MSELYQLIYYLSQFLVKELIKSLIMIVYHVGGYLSWCAFLRVLSDFLKLLQSVAGSDHPRLIYAADKDAVRLIDLRVGISDG